MGMREAYQEKAYAQLCEWQAWIDQIKNEATSSYNHGQAEWQRAVSLLEDCYRVAQIRLAELGYAQDEHWELTKQTVERAMIDLKQALDRCEMGRSRKVLRLQDRREYAVYPFDRKG